MDDNRFDEIVKEQVSDFEDSFDPSALAALHLQMAAAYKENWYSRYKTEFVAGTAVILIAAVLLLTHRYSQQQAGELGTRYAQQMSVQNDELENLRSEINGLKFGPADTVRIIETRDQPSYMYQYLSDQVRKLEQELRHRYEEETLRLELPVRSDEDVMENVPTYSHNTRRITIPDREFESMRAIPHEHVQNTLAQKKLSVPTLRDMEKHYKKGIGIRIGPLLETSAPMYDVGKGHVSGNLGFMADFILSPALAIETGIKYSKRYYEVERQFSQLSLPGLDETADDPLSAEIDNWFIEIPVNIRYRHPVNLKTHWISGVGFSSMFYLKQIFEYNHKLDNWLTVTSTHESNKWRRTSGLVNISVGISRQLRNNKVLEADLFYQHGLGNMGIENNNASHVGIRGTYWFKIH